VIRMRTRAPSRGRGSACRRDGWVALTKVVRCSPAPLGSCPVGSLRLLRNFSPCSGPDLNAVDLEQNTPWRRSTPSYAITGAKRPNCHNAVQKMAALALLSVALSACFTECDYHPYSGVQGKNPTATGSFIDTKYAVPTFYGYPRVRTVS
jgi:hypothetical protein